MYPLPTTNGWVLYVHLKDLIEHKPVQTNIRLAFQSKPFRPECFSKPNSIQRCLNLQPALPLKTQWLQDGNRVPDHGLHLSNISNGILEAIVKLCETKFIKRAQRSWALRKMWGESWHSRAPQRCKESFLQLGSQKIPNNKPLVFLS